MSYNSDLELRPRKGAQAGLCEDRGPGGKAL